jgi:opine dehydrogenase
LKLTRRTISRSADKNEETAMPDTTVAIIGAGIGGIYLAAELGMLGCKLRLHDLDDSRLAEIRTRGGIDVARVNGGSNTGFAAIERVTTDLAATIDGADVIVVVTGGNAQEAVAASLAPLLRDGQIILLIQGNTGGSLVVRRALDRAGCRARVDIAEMDNYPYSCWRRGPTRIEPIVRKRWLQIAAFPGNRIGAVFPRLSPLFPHAVAAANAVFTGFTNANAMLHVANCVANAGKIDRGEAYKFYAEGVTPSVARLYQAINAERVAVAAAYGASVPTLEDWFEQVYGVRGADLSETCRLLTTNSDGPYQATGTPASWSHKYIAEDVPVGLMPMQALGAAAGVPTPAIDAVIRLAAVLAASLAISRQPRARSIAWVSPAWMPRRSGAPSIAASPDLGRRRLPPVQRQRVTARPALHVAGQLAVADLAVQHRRAAVAVAVIGGDRAARVDLAFVMQPVPLPIRVFDIDDAAANRRRRGASGDTARTVEAVA